MALGRLASTDGRQASPVYEICAGSAFQSAYLAMSAFPIVWAWALAAQVVLEELVMNTCPTVGVWALAAQVVIEELVMSTFPLVGAWAPAAQVVLDELAMSTFPSWGRGP